MLTSIYTGCPCHGLAHAHLGPHLPMHSRHHCVFARRGAEHAAAADQERRFGEELVVRLCSLRFVCAELLLITFAAG